MSEGYGDRKYTASVVGAGNGGRLSLTALKASARFDVVALADIRDDARQAAARDFPSVRTFKTHSEMFAECPVDVVCVSTYPPSHEEITLDALATLPLRGILVEKPLGHTAASGRRILDAVRERNLPMAVPHGLLAKKTPTEIIERIRRGDIGELKLVEIQNRGWDIINAGIHWLHFFVCAASNDPIAEVLAQTDRSTRTYRDGMQVETIAVTSAQNRRGVRVVMHTGDDVAVNVPGKDCVFRLLGTRGAIEFYGWENGYFLNADWIVPNELPATGHRRHLENLAASMDAATPDYAIAESSLMALEICEAAYLSARDGCRVKFPLAEFKPPAPSDWAPGRPYSGVGGGRDGRNL